MAGLCLAPTSSDKSNYMFCFSQNEFTSRGEHSHISSSEMTGSLLRSVCWNRVIWFERDHSRSSPVISWAEGAGGLGVRGLLAAGETERSRKQEAGGQLRKGCGGHTELKAIDAQAWICGVVQSSLLPPAAGGVCVHLPGCNTFITNMIYISLRQFELLN